MYVCMCTYILFMHVCLYVQYFTLVVNMQDTSFKGYFQEITYVHASHTSLT